MCKRLKIFNEVAESLCVPLGSAPRLKSGQPGRVGRPVVWDAKEPQHLPVWTPSRKKPGRTPHLKVIMSLQHQRRTPSFEEEEEYNQLYCPLSGALQ